LTSYTYTLYGGAITAADRHEPFMALALKEAEKAFSRGDFPVGCVIAYGNRIVAAGARKGTASEKEGFSEIDHAEIRAIKDLEKKREPLERRKAVLYCTMEPCLMCFAATILSGITTIVYAYEDPMGGGTACDLKKLPPLYRESHIRVIPGVLRQKSLVLFKNFFRKQSNQYWKKSLLEQYTLDQQG